MQKYISGLLSALLMASMLLSGNVFAEESVPPVTEPPVEYTAAPAEGENQEPETAAPAGETETAPPADPTEEAGTPTPEATEEATPTPEPTLDPVDYGASVADNPAFFTGYVRVMENEVPAFPEKEERENELPAAVLSEGMVLYLADLSGEDPEQPRERVEVLAGANEGIRHWYVEAGSIRPMREEETAEYLQTENLRVFEEGGVRLFEIFPLLLATVPPLAAEALRVEPLWEGGFPSEPGDASLLDTAGAEGGTLREALSAGLAAYDAEIDLTPFALDGEAFPAAYQALMDEDLSLFHVSGDFGLDVSTPEGLAVTLRPGYRLDAAQLEAARAAQESGLAALAGKMLPEARTDAQRMMILHGVISAVYGSAGGHDAYDAMANEKGSSHAIAQVLQLALERLQIPSVIVRSAAMGRAWNMVLVGGQWYHVDLFADIEASDAWNISYAHLLLSDAKMTANGYHGWEIRYPATDTTYDEMDWSTFLVGEDTVELYHMGGLPEAPEPDTGPRLFRLAATLEDALYEGLMNEQDPIDVSAFGVYPAEFRARYQNLVNSKPELFFLSDAYGYYYNAQGQVTALTRSYVKPLYIYTGSDRIQKLAEFNNYAQKIINKIPTGVSDVEKALFVFDFFTINFSYSYSGNYNYNPYWLFMSKDGVCQAYALGYEYVMQKLGIPVQFVSSPDMNHAWVQIYVNGAWYNVDPTWGDPTYDATVRTIEGESWHAYFLNSDDRMFSLTYHSYSPVGLATSTSYDSMFWNAVNTPFSYGNGAWHYTYGGDIRKWSPAAGVSTVKTLTTWAGYAGVVAIGNQLIYNESKTLWAIPITGGAATPFYAPDMGTKNIYALFQKEDGYYYRANTSYKYTGNTIHRIPDDVTQGQQKPLVRAFLTRLYQEFLQRMPSEGELVSWTNQILGGDGLTGAQVTEAFVISQEYTARRTSNETFLASLYYACLNRTIAQSEIDGWNYFLLNGCSRRFLLSQMIISPEFGDLCRGYGINPGVVALHDAADHNYHATMFVYRLYKVFLSREPSWGELNVWTRQLLYEGLSGTNLARGFAFSPEFLALPLTDAQFVQRMYEAMLGRAPSSGEVTIWIATFPIIGGRSGLFAEFARSPEFAGLLHSYGLRP